MYYRVDLPDGNRLTDFYADSYYGWGESNPVTLPVSGTYTVYARYNRRGGIDINPCRSSRHVPVRNLRLWRQ